MAYIIEVISSQQAEVRSFLDALYYLDFVSVIGFRFLKGKFLAVGV
ncbi:MAG: hypothetical protein ACR2MD_11540 [Aridibacter sp.]